jgi:hypothetical protein
MDTRLILATFVTLVLPAVMAFWITIHGCLKFWRKAGVIPGLQCCGDQYDNRRMVCVVLA